MVELVERLDFLKEIGPYLVSKLQNENSTVEEEGDSCLDFTVESQTVIQQCKPRIVGQERNGLLLFVWFDPRPMAAYKTIIELFDTESGKARLLFGHEKQMEVVAASVNEEKSLLGFTIRDLNKKSGHRSPGDPREIFRSFVAEVQPQYRVFSLNIEWHTYQKVNFLYSQHQSTKVSHMLFIHHKSSIGLYHIPVSQLGDGSYLMCSQPKTEQVIREFVWCQFDQTLQRLYYVQLVPQDEEEINARAKFGAIEFRADGKFDYILEFHLPIKFGMNAMHQTVQYFDGFLSHTVSNSGFNMEVLTSSRGSFFICYQQPQETTQPTTYTSEELEEWDEAGMTSPNSTKAVDRPAVKYTICCVHGGFNINSVISGYSLTKGFCDVSPRIFFTLFGDYVMVFTPGYCLHLLDCSHEHEPSHHLFLHSTDTPVLPNWDETLHEPLLSSPVRGVAPVLSLTTVIFENITQKQYKVELNHKKLCQVFSMTTNATTRLALLHAAVTHFKNSGLSRKFVEIICQDPANAECTDLVKEYLLACSYDEMKRRQATSPVELKLMPFTCIETFRGQLDRDPFGNKLVHVSYKMFGSEVIEVILNQIRKNGQKFWAELRNCLSLVSDDQFHRFPFTQLSFLDLDVPEDVSVKTEDGKRSLLKRFSQAANRRVSMGATFDMKGKDGGAALYKDIQTIEEEVSNIDEARRQQTIEKLNLHCNTCLPRESKTKMFTLSKNYADTRKKAVTTLWEIIVKAYKYSSPLEILNMELTSRGSRTDCSIFEMVERINYAMGELCYPSFPNMQTIALTLAFRCLPGHLFMHYVRESVFQVTERFVNRFVSEVPDTNDEYLNLKVQLVSELPRDRAKSIIHNWRHPIARSYIAQQMMQPYIDEDNVTGGAMHKVQESGAEDQFLPLCILLHSLDTQGTTISTGKGDLGRIGSKFDIEFIDSVSLTETRKLKSLFES